MQHTNLTLEDRTEKLDADAVCSRCHAVNPDGALICHACGNNLRDQRAERLDEEYMLLGHEKGRKRQIVFRFFAGIVFLGLIGMALNPSAVTDWIVRIQTSAVPDGRVLWQGDDGAFFDGLAAELDAGKPSMNAVRSVFKKPIRTGQTDGMYAVTKGGKHTGYAIARKRNGLIYVAAKFKNGDEVRAKVRQRGSTFIVEPGSAGGIFGGKRTAIAGTIKYMSDGRLQCVGRGESTRQTASVLAYHLP